MMSRNLARRIKLSSRLWQMLKSDIAKILTGEITQQAGGLQDGYTELASALHVVEGGDRAVPSQAIAVYKESSQLVKPGKSGRHSSR
jgi:hypothetical protein